MAVTLTMDMSLVNQTFDHGEAIKVVDLETPGFSQEGTNKQVENNDLFDVETSRTLNNVSQAEDVRLLYMTERQPIALKKDAGHCFLENDEEVNVFDRNNEMDQDTCYMELDVPSLISRDGLDEGGEMDEENPAPTLEEEEEGMDSIEEDQDTGNGGSEVEESRGESCEEVLLVCIYSLGWLVTTAKHEAS